MCFVHVLNFLERLSLKKQNELINLAAEILREISIQDVMSSLLFDFNELYSEN